MSHPIAITVDGVTYQSYKECARALGVSVKTVSNYHKAGKLDVLGSVQFKRPIVVNGKQYESIKECANDLGKHPNTVSKYYREGKLDLLLSCQSNIRIKAWGKTFKSQAAAARYKGVAWSTIENWLNNGTLDCSEQEREALKSRKISIDIVIDGKHYTDADDVARDFGCTRGNVFLALRTDRVHKLGKKIGRGIRRFRVGDKKYTVTEFANERNVHPATVHRYVREGKPLDHLGTDVPKAVCGVPVMFYGQQFPSMTFLARLLEVTPQTVKRHMHANTLTSLVDQNDNRWNTYNANLKKVDRRSYCDA